MNQSPSIGSLVAALATAQGAFPPIPKDKTAKVPTKTGGSYEYDYADLSTILDIVRPVLSKNGLAIMQPATAEGTLVTVRTVLAHSSGEWVSEELTMQAADNRAQSLGAAYTYCRRYSIIGMLSLAPDADVDAELNAEHSFKKAAPKQAAPARPPQADAAPAAPAVNEAPAKKGNPVVLAKYDLLLRTSKMTPDAFPGAATRILKRAVTSPADLTGAEMDRVAEAVHAAEKAA